MAKILGRLIGWIINIISIPFVLAFLILSLPFQFLKAKKRINASKLFSMEEKSLLAKSQRVINMNETALIKPDGEILAVAELIEESRIEYQLMKGAKNIDTSFIELLMPRVNILQINITDWENVNNYFEFK
ncbi:MAG: hypothetical protein WBC60_02630 [Cognaticolwellia sp.]